MAHTGAAAVRDAERERDPARRPGRTVAAAAPQGLRPDRELRWAPRATLVLALQRSVGNRAASLVVQRQVPTDRELHTMCFARFVFERMSAAELEQTVTAVDRLLPTLTEDAALETARGNREEARREQAVRRYPELAAHRTAVAGVGTPQTRSQAVEALVTWSREQLDVYPDLVQRYRRQQQPGPAEKVRVLGLAAAAVARMEFLLGTMLHRGGSWETSGANAGPMVDDYTRANAEAWCTRFATFATAAIRGESVRAASGYRVANPQEFAGIDIATDADQGGAFVGARRGQDVTAAQSPFAALRRTLTRIAAGTITDQTAQQAAEEFLRDHVRPQPGDIMVTRRGVANPNSFAPGAQSHTLIVESVAGTEVSLIEGNAGRRTDRVHGRVLDLSDLDDVEEIVLLSRPDLTSGVDAAEEAHIGTAEVAETDQVDEQAMLRPIEDLNILLEELARSEGDVTRGPRGGTVAEMVGNT